MADHPFYDTTDPEVNKITTKDLDRQWRRADALYDPKNKLVGKDEGKFPIATWDDLQKQAGDKITKPYNFQLSASPGVMGRNKLEGKERPIDTTTFSIVIEKLREGVYVEGEISQQRVHFNILETGKSNLSDWHITRRAVGACNQLAGNVYQTDLRYTGLQAVDAVHADDFFRPNGHTTDLLVQGDTTATFDANILDEIYAIACQRTPEIKPFMVDGDPYFGFLAHDNQLADARKSTSQFYAEWIAALQGGIAKGNPIFRRATGLHGNILIFKETHLPRGLNASASNVPLANTRRGVFFGAGALIQAFGRHVRNTDSPWKFFADARDHDDEAFCSASLITGQRAYGVTISGSYRRVGSLVVTTYAKDRISGQGDHGQLY